MAFKEVASLDADVTIAIGKVDKKTGKPYPKQAEGYYLGRRSVESKRGDSIIHFLLTENGNLGVWGTTDLNRKLAQAAPGTMVRITSTGTKATPNGDMYTYKVEADAANTIEVCFDTPVSSYPEDEDEEEVEYEEDPEEEAAYAPSAPTVTSVAERKAKVEALLKNKRKSS